MGLCTVAGCARQCRRTIKKYRGMHYQRRRIHGAVDAQRPSKRDWSSKYTVDENGCWNWTGTLDKDGYGCANAHRRMWIRKRGPIPSSMHLDHLCKNRKCINPKHLEVVTPADNVRRSNSTRLCWSDVRNIRTLVADGIAKALVAKMYLMGPTSMNNIVFCNNWKE